MKVFLSWSGDRARQVAEALKDWIPDVLQAVTPWVSSQDIAKGARATREIADELSGSAYGVICLTTDNQESQWLNFEAGALSKQVGESLVVPFLLDMKPAETTGPLRQFQAAASDNRQDVLRLMLDMNRAIGTNSLPDDRVTRTFDRTWAELDEKLSRIRESSPAKLVERHPRSESDMLEEILLMMRQQERRLSEMESVIVHEKHASLRKNHATEEIASTLISIGIHPDRMRLSGRSTVEVALEKGAVVSNIEFPATMASLSNRINRKIIVTTASGKILWPLAPQELARYNEALFADDEEGGR